MNDNEQYQFPQRKIKSSGKSGSIGSRSSKLRFKHNNQIKVEVNKMNLSFFNESQIKVAKNKESGEFIYFKKDSVLTELQLEKKKKLSTKQQQAIKKKNEVINISGDIQFENSLQKNNYHESFEIKEYGTGKSNLPPTLKKPKFAFKISQTAESSFIIKDQSSLVIKQVEKQYQLQVSRNYLGTKQKNIHKNQLSKQSVQNNISHLKRNDHLQKQNSISSIRNQIQQPSVVSKSLSQSNSLNGSNNTKFVFKHRIQKASLINSSLNKKHHNNKSNNSLNNSISKHQLAHREVKNAQSNDLTSLSNKLEKLKHQNKKIVKYMIQKDKEIQKLQKKKMLIQSEDPYAIVKENQLMKVILSNKIKMKNSNKIIIFEDDLGNANSLRSEKSYQQLNFKKSSKISSLHDQDITEHKFKVETKSLSKNEKKMILTNRGLLLLQKNLDLGYSLKENILTLYLTLQKEFDEIQIKLQQNSFVVSNPINKVFRVFTAGKQIKFKTEIKSTRCINPQDDFSPLCVKLTLCTHHKFQRQKNQFNVQIPITVYNISKQIELVSNSLTIQQSPISKRKEIFKTQSFVACKDMIQNPESFLMKLFPIGAFYKDRNSFQVGFMWKEKKEFFNIRIKERSFIIEGQGNPIISTFQLLRSIVSLLIEEKKED